MAALEIFFRECVTLSDQELEATDPVNISHKIVEASEVDLQWQSTAQIVEQLREARVAETPGKRHRRVLQEQASRLRKEANLDLDVVSYFLRGIIARYQAPKDWQAIYSLVPSILAYQSDPEGLRVLKSHCLAYILLQLILPKELLPFCDQEVLRTLTIRDSTNAFGLWSDSRDEYLGYGVWVEASFFNHSCDPNLKKDTKDRAWLFELARDIKPGEELCISYLGQEELKMPIDVRRERLLRHWGFLCLCSRCTKEAYF
jgi:SET and MYND domain-containing protein